MVLKTVTPASQYAMVVEQQNDGSWLAQVLGASEYRIQSPSRETAIEQLQAILENRFSNAEVLYYNMPSSKTEHPWMKDAGIYENDPLFEEVLEYIADYRRELDADRSELVDLASL